MQHAYLAGFHAGHDYARGGIIEDQYPTHYMPHVGRQVMADGGGPVSSTGPNDDPAEFDDGLTQALMETAARRDRGNNSMVKPIPTENTTRPEYLHRAPPMAPMNSGAFDPSHLFQLASGGAVDRALALTHRKSRHV